MKACTTTVDNGLILARMRCWSTVVVDAERTRGHTPRSGPAGAAAGPMDRRRGFGGCRTSGRSTGEAPKASQPRWSQGAFPSISSGKCDLIAA